MLDTSQRRHWWISKTPVQRLRHTIVAEQKATRREIRHLIGQQDLPLEYVWCCCGLLPERTATEIRGRKSFVPDMAYVHRQFGCGDCAEAEKRRG